MLQKQNVPVPMSQGMETKTDKKQLQVGKLTLLQNGVFTTPNRISKRPGHDGLSQSVLNSSTAISSGRGVTGFKDELLMNSDSNLYSYAEGSQVWVNKGTFARVTLSSNSVTRNTYQQTVQDSAYHSASGLQCFAWEDSSGGSRYSVIDYATKQQVVPNALIATTAQRPKCFALGSYLLITYFDTTDSHIKLVRIPVINPLLALNSDFITNSTDSIYDGVVISDRLFVAYNSAAGALSQVYINSALTVSVAVTSAAVVATSITVFSDASDNLWVLYYNGTDVKYLVRNYALASTPVRDITTIETVANVKSLTGAVIGTTAKVFYDITSGTSYNYLIRTNTATLAGVVGTASVLIRSLFLASKAFVYNSMTYLVGGYAGALQPTDFLLNSSGQVVAKISPLSAGGLTSRNVLPPVVEIHTGVYNLAYLQRDITTAVDGQVVSQTGVMQETIDFTETGLLAAEVASNLHIAGGYLAQYDGATFVEHGFHLFPEPPTLVASNGAGSIANGTYQYVTVFEWSDNFGQIHRSAPSEAVTIVVSGTDDTVTVTIPTLRVTAKTNVSLAVYRTVTTGSIFYRVTSLTSPTLNSTTADTVTFVDLLPDATIVGNDLLYTTGGVVENISLPATNIITNFDERLVGIPAENPYAFWYSKTVVQGYPVEFSDLFIQNVDQVGGPITAAGVLDDKLILFKAATKYYVYGSGPADTGANNSYSSSIEITGDGGSVNQRSIVTTPIGLMYQSLKGIYLLDRSLQDNYIGSPMQAYTENALVTSALLMETNNQIRFTLDSGVTLMYDYFVKEWSVFTGLDAQDSFNFQDTYCLVRSSGQVLRENPLIFTDAGNPVRLKIRTGWISFAGMQGYKRVYKMLILGEYKTAHKLIVSVAVDFNDAVIQQTYIDAGDLLDFGTYGDDPTYGDSEYYGSSSQYPQYQFRVHMERQKCESIQITLEDVLDEGTGEGYSLSNLAFEVGLKQGLDKIRAAASYG